MSRAGAFRHLAFSLPASPRERNATWIGIALALVLHRPHAIRLQHPVFGSGGREIIWGFGKNNRLTKMSQLEVDEVDLNLCDQLDHPCSITTILKITESEVTVE